jgi:hypothetical protein
VQKKGDLPADGTSSSSSLLSRFSCFVECYHFDSISSCLSVTASIKAMTEMQDYEKGDRGDINVDR